MLRSCIWRVNLEKTKYSRISWLPNFCTTLTYFLGFLAITSAASNQIDKSCYYIFFAAVTDFLDGRVARMTGSESDFGAAYDSLADLIAFGVAPGIICYYAGLITLAKIGWCVAFLYATSTALRLARFNTQEQAPGAFSGMPCPASALFVVSSVLLMNKLHMHNLYLSLNLVLGAILQVSSIPFKHTKQVSVPAKFRLLSILGFVLLLCLIFIYPAWVIYSLMSFYIIYSVINFFLPKT